MGDFIKGSELDRYSEAIQKGVVLHRLIDTYTDQHQIVKQSKSLIRPYFKKYAPVVADVYYDFFLGKNWSSYHPWTLESFADWSYAILREYHHQLPTRSQRFFYYLTTHNMLVNYRTLSGMERVFHGMSHRAAFDSGMEKAHEVLARHEKTLSEHFSAFFIDLKKEVMNSGIELEWE